MEIKTEIEIEAGIKRQTRDTGIEMEMDMQIEVETVISVI